MSNETKDADTASPSSTSQYSSTSPYSAAKTSTYTSNRRPGQLVNADGLYKYSCVVCATRKIKCDRRDPCGNCTKANSTCTYRAPPPPRRRKKGVAAQSTVIERLKRAEELLTKQQAGTGMMNNLMWRLSDVSLENRGQLISTDNSSRYLDNSMWCWLNEELKDIRSVIEDEEEDSADNPPGSLGAGEVLASSILLAGSPKSTSLHDQHPSPVEIFKLWQLYLENVHPLMKVLHAPTVQQRLLEAAGHLEDVPKDLECLMFSIYYVVSVSMMEDECQERFQEHKSSMIARYCHATQLALLKADFLTSYSITVLQAFMIYLIALRPHVAPSAMWALSGIAIRMAHRMGLHRDGEVTGLPVFDVELRRRLWWEIIFFDGRTAQLSGTGGISLSQGVEFRPPRNVNDSELFPGMKTPPIEHEGITEMIHAMIRSEIGGFLLSFPQHTGTFDGSWQGISHSDISLAEKDRMIDELEVRLNRKFISKCDPLIPQHLLAMKIARSAISNIRFMAHNPRKAARNGVEDPEEANLLFDSACRILDNTLFVQTDPHLRRFLYYTRMHFQYLAMVFLLRMLRTYTTGPKAVKGWQVIHGIFELDPPILPQAPKSLYKAICDLMLPAWFAYQAANPGIPIPAYVQELKLTRPTKVGSPSFASQGPSTHTTSPECAPYPSTNLNQYNSVHEGGTIGNSANAMNKQFVQPDMHHPNFMSEQETMDWDDWDSLIQIGDIQSIDLSNLPNDLFMSGQPMGDTVPLGFPNIDR